MVRISCPVSALLTLPHFVNNDYVIVEINYSTGTDVMNVQSWATLLHFTCMSFNLKALAAAILQLCWSNIMAMFCEVMLAAAVVAPSGGRLCYSCCASQGNASNICSSYSFSCLLPASLAHSLPTLGSMNTEQSVNSKTLTILKFLSLLQTVKCIAVVNNI